MSLFVEWQLNQTALVAITLYFIAALFILALKIVSNQHQCTRGMKVWNNGRIEGVVEASKASSLFFVTTSMRLMICWIFAFSVAFLAFARLQCGSAISLPPYLCSIILQFLILCESHMLVAEQCYHRYCLIGRVYKCKMILLKFTAFSTCIPALIMPTLFCFVGRQAFGAVKDEARPSQSDPTGTWRTEAGPSADRIFSDTCWINWEMFSVKVTSSIVAVTVFVCIVVTFANVVTLLRIEVRGTQVSYKTWWGVAARLVYPTITAAKWASVAFEASCSTNFYNVLVTIFVTPIIMAIMFGGPSDCQLSNTIRATRLRPRNQQCVTLNVIELSEPKETDPMMLHHDVLNGDVTSHVTHGGTGLYPSQRFFTRENNMGLGENNFTHTYNGDSTNDKYYMKNKGRNSSDVDDGVISNDGDYDPARQNLDTLEAEMEGAGASGYCGNKEKPLRLSHAESTDSGMGFSDNPKDGENSRLSANDGYGTIHMIAPPQEEPENRKSLIDGDAEYDEVMEFISTPTDEHTSERAKKMPLSTFQTPQKTGDDNGNTSGGDSGSKYAELDLAKILHTRRRHRNTATLNRRQTTEDRLPDESMFNSLKRKPKSKNYSFSAYATYGRNRKSSRQQNTDSWTSRPSSTCNENEDILSPLSDSYRQTPSTSFDRRPGNYTAVEIPITPSPIQSSTRRNIFTNDLMMTSDVNDDVMESSASLDRRLSWRTRPKSPPVVDNQTVDVPHGSNRWSWFSNTSSHAVPTEDKASTPNKSPWKIFRRLLGGGDSKNKHVTSPTISAASLSPSRSRSTSLFRRFSTKKSNKSHLNKRRNSVPAKSEWDVHMPDEETTDIHIPVIDAGKQRPVAPKALSQKPRGRLSSRLMSFRGGKNRNPKRSNDPMSKGLSISSPQLAVNAIDPTRNYSEHQLVNLNSLSISSGNR